MSTASESPQTTGQSSAPASLVMPNFFPMERVIAQLSEIRHTQPVAAIASAHQYQAELTPVFLNAMEQALADPVNDFAKHGMLFNYAVYFLAKWREARAFPLFLRWFSLPTETAFELGGETVTVHGARFLASVVGSEVEALKRLTLNPEAHDSCRGQAVVALAVLVAWGEQTREAVEAHIAYLAREGLPRVKSRLWTDVALVAWALDFRSIFPDLRRAISDGLLEIEVPTLQDLDESEKGPPCPLLKTFTERHPPITDVLGETRWWAGFQQPRQTVVPAPTPKVGRNDACPCGSGKKFKKCCGA
jgi:hypothetical protein